MSLKYEPSSEPLHKLESEMERRFFFFFISATVES